MNMRLPFISVVMLVVVGVALANPAQAQRQDFAIREWNGGSLASSLRAGTNVSGAGISRSTLGSVHTAYGAFDAASVFGNPAALSFVDIPQIAVDFRLPVANGIYGIGPSSLLGASRIRSETNALLTDLSFDGAKVPVYTHPQSVQAGQPRQLSSFAASYSFGEEAVIAVGFRQPLRLESGISLRGNEVMLSGQQDDGPDAVRIDVLAAFTVDAGLDVSLREFAFGAGGILDYYSFGPVWWGGSLYRSHATVGLGVTLEPQAAMVLGGAAPRYFNDPDDADLDGAGGDSNDFFWNVRGAYGGGGWGARGGLVYRSYSDRWGMTVVGNVAPRLDMNDPQAVAEGYLPTFVDLKGELNSPDEPSLLDVDRVDVAFPTASQRTRDAMGTTMRFRLPSSLTVGLDRSLGRSRIMFNATRYHGDLSISGRYGIRGGILQDYNIGKRMAWGWKGALDLARPKSWLLALPLRIVTLDLDGFLFERFSRLQFNEPRYRFSGGVVTGKIITTGIDNSFAADLDRWAGGAVPMSLSVARTYTLLNAVHVGVTVYSVPDLLFRFSLAIGGHTF